MLNPLQTRAFRDANRRGVKSDRVDAVSIARLLRWEGTRLATHTVPGEHQAAARDVRERAATSVGLPDSYGATSIAVQTLVAHLEHQRAQIATRGERLDALQVEDQVEDAATRRLLASIPGFGRETIRTWCAELPPVQTYAEQARAQSQALPRARERRPGPTSWSRRCGYVHRAAAHGPPRQRTPRYPPRAGSL